MINIAPPEIHIESPHITNKFHWLWEVYDPVTGGPYCGGTSESKALAVQQANVALTKIELNNRNMLSEYCILP
jgi:hypothetical protein